MAASVPPIIDMYRKGRMDIDEIRRLEQADSPACNPWVLASGICLLCWGSFCLGMWIGQLETLRLVKAAEQIEADQ